jgi:error-prone DNA polymerase
VDDLWRRAEVPVSSLVGVAEADGIRESLGLARREALWAIKALRDEPLELFAAAVERERRTIAEIVEPEVELRAMTSRSEVVEDYRHVGLTLRRHPVTFLREDLTARGIVTCADAMAARDGRWLTAAGLVLVRQKPGSAKGIMFITIEDESGVANLVIWPSLYERQRRIILGASMIAVKGRVQREGEVVHLVAIHLTDMSMDLAGVGERDDRSPLPHGRGDEFHHGGSPGARGLPPKGLRTRDIYIPDLHLDSIKVKTRDFR